MNNKSDNFEESIIWYLNHPDELKKLIDNLDDNHGMTAGRIRTIYARINYGNEDINEIARYYKLPVKLIKDIGNGKLFSEITSKSYYD